MNGLNGSSWFHECRLTQRPKTAGASTKTAKSSRNGARNAYAISVRRPRPGGLPTRARREATGRIGRSATVLLLVLLQDLVGLLGRVVERLLRGLLLQDRLVDGGGDRGLGGGD